MVGKICVFGVPRLNVFVRTGGPKMSAPEVVPFLFGITSALPGTPFFLNMVSLGTFSGWSVVAAPQVVPLRFGITGALPSTPSFSNCELGTIVDKGQECVYLVFLG